MKNFNKKVNKNRIHPTTEVCGLSAQFVVIGLKIILICGREKNLQILNILKYISIQIQLLY